MFTDKEAIEGALPFNFPCFTTHPRSSMTFGDLDPAQLSGYVGAFQEAVDQEIRVFNPDVIHGQHAWILSSLAADSGVPLVLTVHGTDLMGFERWPDLRHYAVRAMDAARKVICISADNEALTLEVFPEHADKIVRMRNGFNPDVFFPQHLDRAEVLAGHGVDYAGERLVLFAGKLTHFKGVDILLDAAVAYESSPGDILTVIAGDGDMRDELEGQMRELGLGSVCFIGNVSQAELARLYNVADVDVPPAPRNIWEVIHRGSMPELQDPSVEWDAFYTDYVRAYLERDVRDIVNVKDESRFYNFMVACAARTGQLFNASDIARTVGVDYKTVQSWVSVLEASGVIHLLKPFWANVEKRLTKTPKLFFMDTGLACHLARWTTSDTLERGAVAGHMFETFAVSEVLKSHMNAGASLRDVWFYRDTKKREIDLVIQHGRTLHPVEVKTAATVGVDAVKNFSCLESMPGYEVGFRHVLCQAGSPYFVSPSVQVVPVWSV